MFCSRSTRNKTNLTGFQGKPERTLLRNSLYVFKKSDKSPTKTRLCLDLTDVMLVGSLNLIIPEYRAITLIIFRPNLNSFLNNNDVAPDFVTTTLFVTR